MYKFTFFLFLTTLCVAKSEVNHETMCTKDYRDVKNNAINVSEYCSNKLYIDKCCGPNNMLFANGAKCVPTKKVFKNNENNPDFVKQYKSINILSSWDVNKTTKNNAVFVHNLRNLNISYQSNCNTERTDIDTYEVLQNGSLLWQSENKNETLHRNEYCLDYKLIKLTNTTRGVKIVIKSYVPDQTRFQQIEKFENLGMLISSFFLLLVLVVYGLLPNLRNLTGLVLMAYTFSLFIAFVTKLIVVFVSKTDASLELKLCRTLTPVVYFAFVSSIFWFSVYAFDVWWGLRNFRIKRISKNAKLVKFMWYSLYAWGSPFLLTAIVVTLDRHSDTFKLKSLFDNCLRKGVEMDYYYKIPTGILIFINIVLFCMTIHNIWMVKRAVIKCHDSRSSKEHSSNSVTYAKLCLMMGVTWCMELVSEGEELWQYILLNLCNLFTGFSIFVLFVCKKKILLQLCQKFNIRNNYITNLELEFDKNRTKSGITRSTGLTSTVRSNELSLSRSGQQYCSNLENIA